MVLKIKVEITLSYLNQAILLMINTHDIFWFYIQMYHVFAGQIWACLAYLFHKLMCNILLWQGISGVNNPLKQFTTTAVQKKLCYYPNPTILLNGFGYFPLLRDNELFTRGNRNSQWVIKIPIQLYFYIFLWKA